MYNINQLSLTNLSTQNVYYSQILGRYQISQYDDAFYTKTVELDEEFLPVNEFPCKTIDIYLSPEVLEY